MTVTFSAEACIGCDSVLWTTHAGQDLWVWLLSCCCAVVLCRRSAGVTGWSSVLRTLLVHQEHWQSLGLLNFLQLASTPPAAAGEWEEDDSLELQGQEWGEEGEEGEEEYGGFCVVWCGLPTLALASR